MTFEKFNRVVAQILFPGLAEYSPVHHIADFRSHLGCNVVPVAGTDATLDQTGQGRCPPMDVHHPVSLRLPTFQPLGLHEWRLE